MNFVSSFEKFDIPVGFGLLNSPFDGQPLAFGPSKDKVCVNIPICDGLDLNYLNQALDNFEYEKN